MRIWMAFAAAALGIFEEAVFMISPTVVELSRLQFAAAAFYHFLFVPLTLGMSVFLVAVETVYVITGRPLYKQMAQFWGKLFLINFALGVATGLIMEFEFGTNWSYYSNFVGDLFGVPLAIEALMAFLMESTFVGLMVFGWDRLKKAQHFLVTFLVALGSNLSALWILIANRFMQEPKGIAFNFHSLRLEMTDFSQLVSKSDAQAKFIHTSVAGYVTAAVFVCGVSGYYLYRRRHLELARHSFQMAALFGVLATAGVIIPGAALGLVSGHAKPAKSAAVDAIKHDAKLRIINGIHVVQVLRARSGKVDDPVAIAQYRAHAVDLGHGLLIQCYAPDPGQDDPAAIEQAARKVIPPVAPVFWSFRVMVAADLLMLAYFALAVIFSLRNQLQRHAWLLRWSPWMIPVPFIAGESGWVVAEVGRQPWTMYGMLPTFLSVSDYSVGYMVFSLCGVVEIYTLFAVIGIGLMLRAVRLGPEQEVPPPSGNTPAAWSLHGPKEAC